LSIVNYADTLIVGRGYHVKHTSRFEQSLIEERLDKDGAPIEQCKRHPRKSAKNNKVTDVINVDSDDPNDNDFEGFESDSESDSDNALTDLLDDGVEGMIGNDEVSSFEIPLFNIIQLIMLL